MSSDKADATVERDAQNSENVTDNSAEEHLTPLQFETTIISQYLPTL